jgi:CheY-like chemotaxis protein
MANEKVLIVDDEASVRKLIKKSFARENILNFEATCGKEALEMLLTNSFDLIILDIMMKDMDGLEVLKK